MPLALGPFDLTTPVARGGTGEVWRAVHRAQGMPVAIKIVTVDAYDERAFRARFAREVQAMAQLHHPAVARIYDYGEVDGALSTHAGGRLPAQASWLAMEWLGGGALDVDTRLEWPVLRATLLTLLDALAHAHAHAVIHLDLKPDNVLLADRGPVLTDFGLAFSVAARESLNENQVFGTPGYMAPEQIHGLWRDFGPWTDLYALGCLAYELVCGFVPHGRGKPGPLPLMMAHVSEPLPPLEPRMALPSGFSGWLDRLLARHPTDRFRFAADAAVALLALPGGTVGGFAPEATASFDSIAEAMGSVEWVAGDTASVEIALEDTVELDALTDADIARAMRRRARSAPPRRPPSTAPAPRPPSTAPPPPLASHDPGSTPPDAMPAYAARHASGRAQFIGVEDTIDAHDPAVAGAVEAALPRAETRPPGFAAGPPPSGVFPVAGPSFGSAPKTLVMGPVFLPIDDTSWAAGPTEEGFPPMPASWRRHADVPPPPLLDAGEALVRLRTPAPVGRTAERDALWAALRRATEGETRLVLIEGPAGQGKTHLAQWLATRAHELGVAEHLEVHHAASADETSGIAPALVRHMRLEKLEPRERLDRIRALTGERLDAEASRAFAASISKDWAVSGVTSKLMIESEAELDAARAGGLVALCATRPLVLHLDDVQWGWTSIRFARHLLDRHPAARLLIVATVRDDALRPGSLERRLVGELATHPRATRIRLGPLDRQDLASLVTSLLPVEPRLVSTLVQRTHGNPLFAVELMRHWIGRGALVPGPDGFRLSRRDVGDELPLNQRAVWTARLSHVLRQAEPEAEPAFELAAVLGPVVAQSEWALVCAAAGGGRPRDGFRRMVDERLVRPEADGRWAFGNAMLREVLLQQARDGGRWQRWHGLCADVLRRMGKVDPGRLLHHLAEAGRHKEALPPALDLADRQIDRGDFVGAEGTLIEAATMLRRIRQPLGSRPWVELSLRWSHACVHRGAHRNALRRALGCEAATRQSGNAHLRGRVLLALARARYACGSADEALQALHRATRAADQSGDRQLSARVRNAAGRCLLESGRGPQARNALHGALDSLRGVHAPRLKGDALRHLADLARREGHPEQVLEHAEAAMQLYRQLGARQQMGQIELLIGDALRHAGRPEDAADHYRAARRLLRATASADAAMAELDLALVLLELGQNHEARPLLEAVVAEVAPRGVRAEAVTAIAHGYLLSCAAADRDWEDWDHHIARVEPLVDGTVVDPDIAHALRRAGRLARTAGQRLRADRAFDVAIAQLRALGRLEDAAALRQEVGR